MNDIFHGDCAQILPMLPADTFDSLVTDPPASIGFMGQAWDGDRGGRGRWVEWLSEIMREVLRVLKPGAHGLVWAIPRRSHWTALALEDAGFEIQDGLHHYFLTGIPKSMNVGKAIDKKLKIQREVIGIRKANDIRGGNLIGSKKTMLYEVTAPASPEAKAWEGWGTRLKPAIEHWWLVRKPLSEQTIRDNVLKWGTGALNIDASRIPVPSQKGNYRHTEPGTFAGRPQKAVRKMPMPFPLDSVLAEGKPRQYDPHPDSRYPSHFIVSERGLMEHGCCFHPPIYCPKPKAKERNKGCEDLPDGNPVRWNKGGVWTNDTTPSKNSHPTVKPVGLMKYFITLLTRPGGHVLDCFAGSFTTGVAAQDLGLSFTGIELDRDYVQIGIRRLAA